MADQIPADTETKRKFKAACAERGLPMKVAIKEAVDDLLKKWKMEASDGE